MQEAACKRTGGGSESAKSKTESVPSLIDCATIGVSNDNANLTNDTGIDGAAIARTAAQMILRTLYP